MPDDCEVLFKPGKDADFISRHPNDLFVAPNNWLDPEVKLFLDVKDELSVCNGLIVRNHCLVPPHSLPNKAINLAHTGHQGIVKTKMLLCEKVWFPSIDKLVEERRVCHAKQKLQVPRQIQDQTSRHIIERSRR